MSAIRTLLSPVIGSRSSAYDNGRQVQLLSAYDTTSGIVLAQTRIEVKSNEIPAFAPPTGSGGGPTGPPGARRR